LDSEIVAAGAFTIFDGLLPSPFSPLHGVYSNANDIQANLHYLDNARLKKEAGKKKREAQADQLAR
jgi:hypothetical protein